MFLIAGSKNGISSNQLHRTLGVTLKTAWFMSHRIREAMRSGSLAPFGQDGGAVEVDETYIGLQKSKAQAKGGFAHKMKVLSLVERNTGQVRSIRFEDTRASEIHPIVRANVSREARLMTDEARMYSKLGKEFAFHGTTLHGIQQYVHPQDRTIHTNTVEGVFSIFKRGMRGIYQQCGEQHLHRYLAEFDFRYNHRLALGYSDTDRTDALVRGIVGKRLTYETTRARA
jgi:transposase-like protein